MKRFILCPPCSVDMSRSVALLKARHRKCSGFLKDRARCDCCDRVLDQKNIATTWTIQTRAAELLEEEWDRSIFQNGGSI